ncbi:MAG: hypothetical protein K2J32_00170 [Ruminococcus sp.]|nr:hypothetical protein [Ruminococcus sp.]
MLIILTNNNITDLYMMNFLCNSFKGKIGSESEKVIKQLENWEKEHFTYTG